MAKKPTQTTTEPIVLGCTATDTITGLTGVVTGMTYYISGCNQALVAPKGLSKDGKIQESHWFDVQRLVRTKDPLITFNNSATPGFDKPAPKR